MNKPTITKTEAVTAEVTTPNIGDYKLKCNPKMKKHVLGKIRNSALYIMSVRYLYSTGDFY